MKVIFNVNLLKTADGQDEAMNIFCYIVILFFHSARQSCHLCDQGPGHPLCRPPHRPSTVLEYPRCRRNVEQRTHGWRHGDQGNFEKPDLKTQCRSYSSGFGLFQTFSNIFRCFGLHKTPHLHVIQTVKPSAYFLKTIYFLCLGFWVFFVFCVFFDSD